jgi:hypothetical protein
MISPEPEFPASSQLVTIDEELALGLKLSVPSAKWLRRFYDSRDEDWLESGYSAFKFRAEWEIYEWLFKRAIAGYALSADDHMFMQHYESRPEYHMTEWLSYRYNQLKKIFADQLSPVFGTYNRRNPQ